MAEADALSTPCPLHSLRSRVGGLTARLNASALLTAAPAVGVTKQRSYEMTQKTLTKTDLRQFTGTEQWYRHWCARKILYTDGVQHVAEHGGAHWLIDEIAFAQRNPKIAAEGFQVWKLEVKPDHTATLSCSDGNYRVVSRKGADVHRLSTR